MSSTELTASKIDTINRLVREATLHCPIPDAARQMEATHAAAMRVARGPVSEAELRAIIYDAVFPYQSLQVH